MTVSPAETEFLRELLLKTSGLALLPGKEYLVESRLSPLAAREGLDSIAELVAKLKIGSLALRVEAAEAMATNETYFFRDVHPFDALRTEIVPAILRANGNSGLSIWSAACAAGQEAYSLAMLVKEYFPYIPNVTILATDFSEQVLDKARKGRYTQLEVNRGLPAPMLVKYFQREGLQWEVIEPVRKMVTFRKLNLIQPLPALPSMDIVFLRNVLTYFDPQLKADVLRRCAKKMRPGGYLFLGGSETTFGLGVDYDIIRVGRAVCYQYRSGGMEHHGSARS